MRILALLPLLLLGALHPVVRAQDHIIDDFNAAHRNVLIVSPNAEFPLNQGVTHFNPNALGGETDVVFNLIDAPDGETGIGSVGEDGVLTFRSGAGTNSRAFISYDGKDGDAIRVQASGGLGGVDLTDGGRFDRFAIDVANRGSAINVSIDVFSAIEERSTQTVEIPAGFSGVQEYSFSDFVEVQTEADFQSVTAVLMILGAGGGATGPIDFDFGRFETRAPAPVLPNPGGGSGVIVDQMQAPANDSWYVTNFPGDNPFDASIRDDFTVTEAARLQLLQFTADWFPSAPNNATADVILRSDDNGSPGNILSNFPNLPIEPTLPITSTATINFGEEGPMVEPGVYWVEMQTDTGVGTDIQTNTTSVEFGSTAQWVNEGGVFGRGCPTWQPITECGSSDKSWRFRLVGELDSAKTNLSVTKELTPERVHIGDEMTFTITVANTSDVAAEEVILAEPFARYMTISSVSPSQGECDGSIECDLGMIGPGASATVTIVALADGTNYVNLAAATTTTPESDGSDNVATVTWTVEPRVEVTKEAETQEYRRGNKVEYEIVIENTTDLSLAGIEFQDEYFPDALTYLGSSGDCEVTEGDVTNVVDCVIPEISPSSVVTQTIEMQIWSGVGWTTNGATVSSPMGVEDIANSFVYTDNFETEVDLQTQNIYLPILSRASHAKGADAVDDLVDLYLGDQKIGEDLAFGQSTGWFPFTVDAVADSLFIVPADCTSAASAIDTVEVLVDPVQGGSSSIVVLVNDESGAAATVVADEVRREASDPALADVVILHAAEDIGTVEAVIDIPPSSTLLAEELRFGASSPYLSLDPPDTYNYVVTRDDAVQTPEVFRIPTDGAGEIYTLVIAPDNSESAGKQSGFTVLAFAGDGTPVESRLVTDVERASDLPTQIGLAQNFPNPFTGQTEIAYDLPSPSLVELELYDVIGRRISTLDSGEKSAGQHRVVLTPKGLAPGVYLYRLTVGSWSESRRMVIAD